jgi:hypothetical protein
VVQRYPASTGILCKQRANPKILDFMPDSRRLMGMATRSLSLHCLMVERCIVSSCRHRGNRREEQLWWRCDAVAPDVLAERTTDELDRVQSRMLMHIDEGASS